MNREDIQLKLKERYDDFSVELLTNALLDFQQLYNEKYLRTDEAINLLFTNTPNGVKVYDDVGGKWDAVCSLSSREFKVNRDLLDKKDYLNYVFFHEFIHAISFKKHNGIQFMGFYAIDKGDEYRFKSESFNEIITEYITLKRNDLYSYKNDDGSLSGYEVGANELKILLKIINEDEFINAYFNVQDDLENILKKYNMNMDEVFYGFHSLIESEADIYSLENRRGLSVPQNIFRIIDGERYLFYNYVDSFGEVQNEIDFNRKWNILLLEKELKYNFYSFDGLLRYGELVSDIDKLNISNENEIYKKIGTSIIEKYRYLDGIFRNENIEEVLGKIYEIYKNDFNKYWDLFQDDFVSLVYTFLKDVKNNFQLYDLEIYPRVYPYLKQENAKIEDVNFSKISCDELKTKFYIFNINGNTYVDINYDDSTMVKKTNTLFEVRYGNNVDILDLSKNIYIVNNVEHQCKVVY